MEIAVETNCAPKSIKCISFIIGQFKQLLNEKMVHKVVGAINTDYGGTYVNFLDSACFLCNRYRQKRASEQ